MHAPILARWRTPSPPPPPTPPSPGERAILAELAVIQACLATIEPKVTSVMTTVADVQAALAANESREATIIGLLTTEAANLKDLETRLAAAISGGSDSAALQAIVDKLAADGAAMDAAIASVAPPATPAAA